MDIALSFLFFVEFANLRTAHRVPQIQENSKLDGYTILKLIE